MSIAGTEYLCYYLPIQAEDGSIQGMIFTGQERSSVQKQITFKSLQMILLSQVLIVKTMTSQICSLVEQTVRKRVSSHASGGYSFDASTDA